MLKSAHNRDGRLALALKYSANLESGVRAIAICKHSKRDVCVKLESYRVGISVHLTNPI